MSWHDDQFSGLTQECPGLDMFTLYDKPVAGKKYTKSLTANVDSELYDIARDLAHHPNAPFSGSVSAMVRHFIVHGVEELQLWLSDSDRTMLRLLKDLHRRQTTEEYILTLESKLDTQIEIMQAWTAAHEWHAVFADLQVLTETVRLFPERAWRTRAAKAFLSHAGLKRLQRTWGDVMKEEDEVMWGKVLELFRWWEEVVDA